MAEDFDVIVVGSGMSGGYAAKELCERGFKVLVIERGRHIEHRGPEYTDMLQPWERKNFELVPEELLEDQNWAEVKYALKPDNLDWFVRFEDAP
jgi:choline dehydrogenase-like flavoprotein